MLHAVSFGRGGGEVFGIKQSNNTARLKVIMIT